MRCSRPFFVLLLLFLIVNSVLPPGPPVEMATSGSSGDLELFGFWTTADGMSTSLLIPNPTSQDQQLVLELFDDKGSELLERSFEVEGSGSIDIPIDPLVQAPETGYLRLSFPNQICILPAQAVVASGSGAWSFDLKDNRLMGREGDRIEALLPLPPEKGRKHEDEALKGSLADVFVLTNLSSETQKGELVSRSDGHSSRKTWSLHPGQTRLIRIKPKAKSRDVATRVELVPDDPSARVLASGLRSLGKEAYAPIHFRAIAAGSGEIAGFFSSGESLLQLWNLDEEEVELEVEVLDETGQIGTSRQVLPAGETLQQPLRELAPLEEDSQGVVVVHFPAETILSGQIVRYDPLPAATAMKDTTRETSLSYGLPVYINSTTTTRVRLFNPNDETLPLCLFLFFGKDGVTYPMKRLGPHQYFEVDLLEARERAVEGVIGRTIPLDAEIGQAKIVLHPETGHEPPSKKFLAMGIMENLESRQKIAFQGCTTCPPVLQQVNFNPSSFTGYVGSQRRIRVMAIYSDGGIKYVDDVTSSSEIFSLSPSIASVDRDQLLFRRAGFTLLGANVFDCTEVEVYEPNGFFPVQECSCSNFGSKTGQASVRSKSTRFTVHMKAFIPYNNVSAPSPEALCLYGFIPRRLVYNGNDRTFSSSLSASYKARLIASVGVSQLESSSGLISSLRSIGPTHSFADDVFYNNNRIDQSEYDSTLRDCHFWHQQDTATASGINIGVQRLGPSRIKITFTGSAKIPLIRLAPAIDWTASLILDSSGEKLKWELEGVHDGFPAYEFYINGLPLYRDAPTSPSQIIYLFDALGDESFQGSGEIQ